jgi:hypothetical protein
MARLLCILDDFNQALSMGYCSKETMKELHKKRDMKTGLTVIPGPWFCPISLLLCSSDGISFPRKHAVERGDNRMPCSSSISAFIYVMMSRCMVICAYIHY